MSGRTQPTSWRAAYPNTFLQTNGPTRDVRTYKKQRPLAWPVVVAAILAVCIVCLLMYTVVSMFPSLPQPRSEMLSGLKGEFAQLVIFTGPLVAILSVLLFPGATDQESDTSEATRRFVRLGAKASLYAALTIVVPICLFVGISMRGFILSVLFLLFAIIAGTSSGLAAGITLRSLHRMKRKRDQHLG